jgi:hypothetical protein
MLRTMIPITAASRWVGPIRRHGDATSPVVLPVSMAFWGLDAGVNIALTAL